MKKKQNLWVRFWTSPWLYLAASLLSWFYYGLGAKTTGGDWHIADLVIAIVLFVNFLHKGDKKWRHK